ncbi:MAG: ATP-binding protein [Verrucomicrobiae bacterium]|nr:ATP-binding protein [Verrucomicrobiae bacterium]
MNQRMREILWSALALLVVAGCVWVTWQSVGWMNRPLPDAWRLALEIVGVVVALQVATFALAQFWLVGHRLTLFVGLAFWTAALTDLVQALVEQGIYGEPPSGRDVALVGAWVLGRWSVASLVVIGVWQQRRGHSTPRAARDFRQAVLLATAAALVLAHLPLVMRLPGLLQLDATISRPWDLAGGVPFAMAMGLCWWIYRQQRGVWLGATFLSLVPGLLTQVLAARAGGVREPVADFALGMKVASYLPPLVGLFVWSVVWYRQQQELTVKLQATREELIRQSQRLEQLVAERTREVEARAKDLEVFAFTVSHDLKAPLRGIYAYTELLLDTCGEQLGEKGQRLTLTIRRLAQTMRRLIDDLLEYSRLQRREAVLAPVEVRELVQSVIRDRAVQIEQAGAEVTIEMPDMVCRGDRMMLYQVLGNLLDNALKYSRERRPPRIVIRGEVGEEGCRVSVSDNGIGFDPEYAEKIFGLFERLHPPEKYEGSGIGLSICRRIIEKHGGRIWAEGRPGQGATFTFVLPCKACEDGAVSA